jgi:folate-binding protein YgfZ
MPTACLADRALVSVSGPDAEHFLQNLLTVDLDNLDAGEARPGALLTPQGKILFDFLISRESEDAFLLECRAGTQHDLVRRLALYRLRAKVDISTRDQSLVVVRWNGGGASSETDSGPLDTTPRSGALHDRRFPLAEVIRSYGEAGDPASGASGADAWRALRIEHGVAESGEDYALSDAFPHDVLLDELGGIGFSKGCYVGQEVVSRMQHRGTARRRVMIVTAAERLPATGTELLAGGRALGALGSVCGARGLAILRIDRVKEALDGDVPITADGISVDVAIPAFASFQFPGEAGGSNEG